MYRELVPDTHHMWDSQNRLRECTYSNKTSTFEYGADGLRRSKTVDDGVNDPVKTHYILDGQSVAQEWVDDNHNEVIDSTETVTYLTGPRGVEFRRDDSTGEIRWYLYDGLGSAIAEVDETGSITASRYYKAFGGVHSTSGTPTGDHKFVGSLGHTSEDDTGLIYMRARYYDPEIGRFISEDPAGDGANWYVYCRNNPVNALDSNGHEPDYIQWWRAGMVFTGIALWSNYFGPARGMAAIRRAGLATAASMAAILCFGYAASGADCIPETSGIVANVLANMLTWGSALAQIFATTNMMAAAAARSHAGIAVSAAAAYSTIIAGIIVSIGTDTGN